MASLFGMIAVSAVFYHYSRDLPDYSDLEHYDPATVTRLYSSDGKLLAEYAVEKRIFVPLSAVPKRVKQAFISAEDKDFYTNTGIDINGIARAMRQNLRSLLGNGKSLAGGSTITQQVVKNFLLTPEKSISRKIKEAILAYRITQVYSKDRILELYLNEIYLGKGSYGVAASAINYFNKSLNELTIEEAAMLAALPKEPAHIDPTVRPARAKERRDWVISRMQEDGYITADEAREATATPITLRDRDVAETADADFFAEEVRRELAAKYGSDTLYKGGLFVKTTLDPVLQGYADNALRSALVEYDRRHGFRGPLSKFATMDDWQKQLTELAAKKRWGMFDEQRLAVVLGTNNGKTSIGFVDGKKGLLDKPTIEWTKKKGLKPGDVFVVAPGENEKPAAKEKPKKGKDKDKDKDKEKEQEAAKENPYYAIHQVPEINGAMIVMDPHTGKVLAMSGGYSYGGTEFNRATQAKRQPGSAFKPFVYLAGLENGFTPSTILVDEPVELSQGTGLPSWRPSNYGGDYLGPATLRTGLEKSRNAMTVKLAQLLGIDKVVEIGTRFGIYDKLPAQFSSVLGANETTLIRLANAYCIIANGGKKVSPSLIERIDDKTGKTILRRDNRECKDCKIDTANASAVEPPKLVDDRMQIVEPRVDYQITSMLQGVAERGTAARARSLGKPVAGKTGTTNDSKDTWFMGFSPDLVAGIYVGFDTPRTLGSKETGGSVALPGFIKFMEKALKNKPSKPFRVPQGITFMRVDAHTGQPPMPDEHGPIIMEAFKEGESPYSQSPDPSISNPLMMENTPEYQFPSEEPAPEGGRVQPNGQGTGGLY